VFHWFISIQLSDGKLQILHDFGAVLPSDTGEFVADGNWHEIVVAFTHNMTSVTVDGNSVDPRLIVENRLQNNSVDNNCVVYLGADAAHNGYFKGCLDEVRVNSLLLPFFTQEDLANDTSVERRFDVAQMTAIRIGCHGDDVCGSPELCLNNGTCQDVWNAHVCDCAPGYNGTSCEVDIDECVLGHECENGATCVDAVASYSCTCAAGFSGLRYVFRLDLDTVIQIVTDCYSTTFHVCVVSVFSCFYYFHTFMCLLFNIFISLCVSYLAIQRLSVGCQRVFIEFLYFSWILVLSTRTSSARCCLTDI